MALLTDPGVEVVGDQREGETGPLGDLRLADELVRWMVFRRKGESELWH